LRGARDGLSITSFCALSKISAATTITTMNVDARNYHIVDSIHNRFRAMVIFQNHMIARMDDIAHMKKSVLKSSPAFAGYLTAKISWSKNVRKKSNCPVQLLLPDMDPRTCVYLSLALFLERLLQFGNGDMSQWLFD